MINSVGASFVTDSSLSKIKNDDKKIQNLKSTAQSAESDSKVSKIAKAIADGTYKIDLNKTAKAVANELF
ncbi:flagellar biosynthesis anti-sigma factor FlgM [Campylobacter sp. RM12327]|uniref:flagellar biosynthesis anti-sigma factor FlgM n=1 Tax=Campylobacter sputorum TaxID=206 RepID=UPI00053BDB50|nr:MULTISPECIES: flagellar biosynthesis anti-sigma factor FlgM [Campylobacter]ASM40217.1 anti-sigma factor FlgM [Campylobacter sputorum]MBE7358503.1 flagellar biosynthesis anti-sigma factor FlgM [Campylobacter sp. RM11302]MBF6669746.1 flagellar biosynthesis anti-sigma factor FlgM [Campylobacter sp. RM12327]MBF6674966.1 flagellar biosynthesis anti-sigma factor FlgM [Campylobacter sp. RM13538]MBF6676334.1 flagellar biosynthesis anti-sigma factor FlgM [Campylobacter sp. RM12321]